jgi:DNA-binding GntR family transcriptional regulator
MIADDARQLACCIIGANDSGTLAHEVVSAVEIQFLQRGWPVGEPLGALAQVQKDLGLGRPACREAITILEARGVLDVRRGPGGGVFVAAPTAEDVVEAMLMYLLVTGADPGCIQQFRHLAWRMVVETALERGIDVDSPAGGSGEWGFAVHLAERIGNPAITLTARIAEMLVRACDECPAPSQDTMPGLEAMEQRFARSGRKSAMALAARMSREMMNQPERPEAEWETADRLGYSDAVVRQARRILQDFGLVRCQRGRKGLHWSPPPGPGGVIRLLAPCLIASGMSARDNAEAANFLACNGPRLAAERTAARGTTNVKLLGSFANSLELIDLIRTENFLLELACNPLLSIMTRSLGLANLVSPGSRIGVKGRVDIVAINHRILRAIEAGDAGTAAALARAKGEIQQTEAHYRLSA